MCQLLERKLADSQLFHEFEKIPKKKQNADLTTAQHPDNAAFNRHKDVLPYEVICYWREYEHVDNNFKTPDNVKSVN